MSSSAERLFPLFLKLAGRRVVVVGGGPVAAAKVEALGEAGAEVVLVTPEAFAEDELDGAWLVVAAASPEVNAAVRAAAEARRLFVLAVDDPALASAYGAGTLRRGGVTVAVSTDGRAPALAGLLREALEAVLPEDLAEWTAEAERQRAAWRASRVPMAERRPLLLEALNRLYRDRKAAG